MYDLSPWLPDKPSPEIIPEIDTRKRWEEPLLMEIDGALAYDLIVQVGSGAL